MYKKHNIELFRTYDEVKVGMLILKDNGILEINQNPYLVEKKETFWWNKFKEQHLYILSEEKVKKNDFYFSPNTGIIICKYEEEVKNDNGKKIIATTHKELIEDSMLIKKLDSPDIHLIPKSFVGYYEYRYNKGKRITKVNLKYEENLDILKVNNDNTIIMKY